MKKYTNLNLGFTLIELLVVIAIIAMLASVIIASVSAASLRSRDTRRIQDVNQIQKALELYFVGHGRYPGTDDTRADLTSASAVGQLLINDHAMSVIPSDPLSPDQEYEYTATNLRVKYKLYFTLEGSSVPGYVQGENYLMP